MEITCDSPNWNNCNRNCSSNTQTQLSKRDSRRRSSDYLNQNHFLNSGGPYNLPSFGAEEKGNNSTTQEEMLLKEVESFEKNDNLRWKDSRNSNRRSIAKIQQIPQKLLKLDSLNLLLEEAKGEFGIGASTPNLPRMFFGEMSLISPVPSRKQHQEFLFGPKRSSIVSKNPAPGSNKNMPPYDRDFEDEILKEYFEEDDYSY